MIALFWFICGISAAYVARKKGKSVAVWLLLGVLLGPLAILMVGFAPAEQMERETTIIQLPRSLRKCPFCAEDVQWEALICKHCGRTLPLSRQILTDFTRAAYDATRERLGPQAGWPEIAEDLLEQGLSEDNVLALVAETRKTRE